jgi:alkylation response protein AidB-like acyl-CoA dehydrogenase
MDFTLSERQTHFRDRVRAMIETRVRPRIGDYHREVAAGPRWKVLPGSGTCSCRRGVGRSRSTVSSSPANR